MRLTYSIDHDAIDHVTQLVESNTIGESCRLLGEGLSGKVYEFENYAVKVFKEDFSENDDDIMLKRLGGHPSFPRIHYREDRFMVVDKIAGPTLSQALKAGERLSDRHFEQVEEAVEDCWRMGIIPDDLHLNNIMIGSDNRIKIIDVGRFFHTTDRRAYLDPLRNELEELRFLFGSGSSSKRERHSSSHSHSHSHKSRSHSHSHRSRSHSHSHSHKSWSHSHSHSHSSKRHSSPHHDQNPIQETIE
jgi:predicted Ser/Thr protein kinase